MKTEEAWKPLLETVMPHFQKEPMRFVIDLTSYAEHAQVIYLGIIQHSRVLPLVWKVMPGQEKWDQGLWDAIEELFKRLEPYLEKADCTLIGVSRVWMLSNGAIVSKIWMALCVSHLWTAYVRILVSPRSSLANLCRFRAGERARKKVLWNSSLVARRSN